MKEEIEETLKEALYPKIVRNKQSRKTEKNENEYISEGMIKITIML